MSNLLYVHEHGSIGIEIREELICSIFKMCKNSYPKETGGILIGRYSSNLQQANVLVVTEAPTDSKSGRTWFYRGTNGLQKLLNDAWNNNNAYYLGEWHYHPGGAPNPSINDIVEMKKISRDVSYNCPEPVLIIAGSVSPSRGEIGVYIFLNGSRRCTLKLR